MNAQHIGALATDILTDLATRTGRTPPMAEAAKKQEVVTRQDAPATALVSETAAVLSIIERAAKDPSVDIDKMERLMLMHERVMERQAKAAYARDLADMIPNLPSIDRKGAITLYSKADREFAEKNHGNYPPNARPMQQTPYATLGDILATINPILSQFGFTVQFETETVPVADSYRIRTRAILRHREGHQETSETPPLMQDSSGSKNNVQGVGSSMTYGRRYALTGILPIVSHAPVDADDDGKAAGGPALIDEAQISTINDLLSEMKANVPAFLKAAKVAHVEDIEASRFDAVVSNLRQKLAERKAA